MPFESRTNKLARCTYCCEASLKDIYTGEKFLRRRSAPDTVAELAEAKTKHGAKEIMFEDEIFGMDGKWLAPFTPMYREQVGLPFSAYLYPTRSIDRLLPLLKEAGLASCCGRRRLSGRWRCAHNG